MGADMVDVVVVVVTVCADANAAAAEKTMARNIFFTVFLDLGKIEISNHLYGAG